MRSSRTRNSATRDGFDSAIAITKSLNRQIARLIDSDRISGWPPEHFASAAVSPKEPLSMLKATAGTVLPTTITGSLPRPSWYTENLGIKSFLDAMVMSRFREQYVDALSVYLREQEVAGLDIVTDGDCRFDQDVGGQSWTSYPPHHMDGFETQHPKLATVGAGGI